VSVARSGLGEGGHAGYGAAADDLHARCDGGPGWYVGTADDPQDRLAVVHGVDLETGRFAIVKCANAGVAIGAARLLREEHGYQPAAGCRGPGCVYLYAYSIGGGARGPS
jgi:hypothetical protein